MINTKRNRSEPETGRVGQAEPDRWRNGCVWQIGKNLQEMAVDKVVDAWKP